MWLAPGLRGASGNYYCGLHEYADMAFVLHFLRPGELFVDVGANVGSYSLLAAAECGARVKAYEPVPATFEWLKRNVAENGLQNQVQLFNHALGAENGMVAMTAMLDAQNHLAESGDAHTINVPIRRLDDSLAGDIPTLIKIDVEGAEDQVLAGVQKTIADSRQQALIIEMTNKAFPGSPIINCHAWLLQQGYTAFRYEPESRTLVPLQHPHWHNTIYLRYGAEVQQRLAIAPLRTWWNLQF
jgi:FkbM family methyltransferase